MKRLPYRRKVLLDRWSRMHPPSPTEARPIKRNRFALKVAHLRIIPAPEKFRAFENAPRATLLAFMEKVDAALKVGGRVKIDFRDTKEIHPCGLLLFMAHFTLWQSRYPGRLTCTYPDDDAVEQLLQHFEVLTSLGLAARKEITHERVVFWRYFTGSDASAGIYRDLTRIVRDSIDHPHRELFADCLNEAVVNAVNHAYEFEAPGLPPPNLRNWWIVSQLRDEKVFVAIYDLGVTIPASLRQKPEWADYLKLRKYKDDRLIETAVTSTRTSTKLPNRGKGFPEMLEFSRNLAAGGLSILSGYGGFSYNASPSQLTRYKFGCYLPGTLVLWEIPFRQERSDG